MTERPDVPLDDPDGIEVRIRTAAERVPTTETDVSLRRVERIARARRRRQRMVVPGVAAVIVAAGIAGVVIVSSSSTTDTVMTPVASTVVDTTEDDTGEDDAVDGVDPTTATTTPPSTSVDGTDDTTPADVIGASPEMLGTFDVEPVTVEAPPNLAEPGYAERVLPFGDGFLVTRPTMVGTPGFDLTVQDAQTLLGLDLAILIEQSGATTEQEAMDAAAAAGRLDDVNAVLAEEPQVLDALLNHRWTPALDLHTSIDGTAWEHTVLALPVETGLVRDVATDGQRLVVAVIDDAGDAEGFRDADVSVMVTSDLATWTTHEWTLPDPARDFDGPVTSSRQGRLIATPDGWTFAIAVGTDLDMGRVWDDVVGDRDAAALSGGSTDDGAAIEVEWPDGSFEYIERSWEELGFDDGGEALRAGGPLMIWSAGWDGEPEFRTAPEASAIFQVAALSDGWFATTGSTVTFVSRSGDDVVVRSPVDGWIVGGFAVDDRAAIAVQRDEGWSIDWFLVDPATLTWAPIEFDRLSSEVDVTPWSGSAWPITVGVSEHVEAVVSTATWEQGDYVYSWVQDGSVQTYEVRTHAGELVVSEAIDWSTAEPFGPRFEHRREGLAGTTITDPSSGEVIISLTPEETRQMQVSATQLDGSALPSYDVTTTQWMLAALDDGRWFLREVPRSNSSVEDVGAINGDKMLVVRGDTWERYDL